MNPLQGILTLVGRVMLSMIFFMSAIGNKIPKFNETAAYMKSEGVPLEKIMLTGAIAFLVAGSLSVIIGFRARIGAALLFVFLVLATYYFHDFWTFDDAKAHQLQMIQFMKNTALMGAMLFIVANGPGPMSIDSRKKKKTLNAE